MKTVTGRQHFWLIFFSTLSVFTRAIADIRVGGATDIDLISYPFFVLAFFMILAFGKVSKKVTIFFIFFSFIGVLVNTYSGYPFSDFVKYFAPIFLIYYTLYHIFSSVPIRYIFELYVEMGYWAALFGLVQFLFKVFFGISLLSRYSVVDIDSIANEPSHYAVIIMPAVVYSILNFRFYKYKALILALSLFLTFKLTAYFSIALVLGIAYFKWYYIILFGSFLLFVYNNYIITVDDYALRINPMLDYFFKSKLPPKNQLHGTPLSFLSNLEVAKYSLKKNLLFGVGFGGHQHAYEEYFQKNSFIGVDYLYGLNSRGGHSLLIRVLSETGLLGFGLYIFFFLKTVILKKHLWVNRAISLGCLSHFIGKALKLSSYIDYGTPFFFMIIFVNWEQSRKTRNMLIQTEPIVGL